jgi:hypothetical protein
MDYLASGRRLSRTSGLRFHKRWEPTPDNPMVHAARLILQQEWVDDEGNREWVDVPVAEEE